MLFRVYFPSDWMTVDVDKFMMRVSEIEQLCDRSDLDRLVQAETFVEGFCVSLEESLVNFFEHILFDIIYALIFPCW